MKYVIKHYDKPGFMVAGIGIGECGIAAQVVWTRRKSEAIQLEEGEAAATIAFVGDVIDWELADGLYAEKMEEMEC